MSVNVQNLCIFITFHMFEVSEFEINWFVYVQQNSSSRDEESRSTKRTRSGTPVYYIFRSEKSHSS